MVLGSQVSAPILDVPGDQFLINGGLLIIISTRANDVGTYTCTATNSVGQASASLSISVFSLSSLIQAQVRSTSSRVVLTSSISHSNQQEFEVIGNVMHNKVNNDILALGYY